MGLGHFGVDGDRAFVFGACLLGFIKRSENVSKLEVCVSEVGLICDDLLQWTDGCFEFLLVNVALRFIQQFVEGVRNYLGLGLCGSFGFGRSLCISNHPTVSWGRRMLRACQGQAAQGVSKSSCCDKAETRVRHGSTGKVFAPLETAAEGPAGFDAPFAGRFAWPLPLRTRARYRPVCDCVLRATCSGVPVAKS